MKAVEVRSWDYERKEPIVARIPKETTQLTTSEILTRTEYGKGRDYSQKFGLNPSEPKLLVVDQPTATIKEAEVMAQALFNELEGDFIYADTRGQGNPRIRPGKVVELDRMGRYSGSYYVTESRHLFYEGIYTTEFSVRGLRGDNLLQTLSPSTRLRPGQTHLVGIVTDNKDPKGWGRVRVKFPTLTPEQDSTAHASYWARVVGVGAGPDRGFDCLPEINDEVLVAFEHGDIHRPYIIGGVWNGKDQPPAKIADSVDKGKVRLRTFKTRTQHTLQFVEEDKDGTAAGIYIQTSQGHQIRLNDSNGSIEVRTKAGQSIRLDDQGGITIESKGNIQLQPGTGQVLVSGNVLATQFLMGTTVNSVNVGETLTNLQQQIQQNTNSDLSRAQEMAQLKEQVQQNITTDIQQAQTLSDLREKIKEPSN